MADIDRDLQRESRRFELRPGALDRFHRRRRQRAAMQRISAGAIAAIVAAGGIWLASSAFRVGEVRRPASRVTLRAEVGGRPGPLAIGFGSVWVADGQDRVVSRIDPGTGSIERAIGLPQEFGAPVAIRIAHDMVWVQTGALAARSPVAPAVVGIDPDTNDIGPRYSLGSSDHAEVAVAFGSVWSANRETGEVVRREAGSGRVLARFPGPPDALMLSAGAGSIWVLAKGPHDADPNAPGTVARIDPRRNAVVATAAVGPRPTAVAVDVDAVWVVTAESATATRVDPRTGNIVATIPVPGVPTSIALGEDAVWVGSLEGKLSRIDPSPHTVVSTVEVGSGIAGLDAAGDVTWTADPGGGTVVRVQA